MKTLNDIAITYASLAYRNISTKGLQTYAVDTGNLKDTVKSYNTPQKMAYVNKGKSFVTYNYAPKGATYGKYVENGTIYMKPRHFAGEVANDPALKKVIKEYQDSQVLMVNTEVNKKVTVMFGKLGKAK